MDHVFCGIANGFSGPIGLPSDYQGQYPSFLVSVVIQSNCCRVCSSENKNTNAECAEMKSLMSVIITIGLFLVSVLFLAAFFNKAHANGRDTQPNKTEYIYLKEDDNRAKYIIGGAAIVGTIWCVVEKCWKSNPPVDKDALQITPENVSDYPISKK
jgi:hypothetical protein